MSRIFISHSSKDRDFVSRKLVPFLQRRGLETWYAPDDIHTAEEWERKIVHALRECPWFLIVLTPNVVPSEWARAEVHWAMEHRKGHVVPLLLGTCDPCDINLKLSGVQHIDFRNDRRTAWNRLARAFGKDVQPTASHEPVKRAPLHIDQNRMEALPAAGVRIEIPAGVWVEERDIEAIDGEWRTVSDGDQKQMCFFPPTSAVSLSSHKLNDRRLAALLARWLARNRRFLVAPESNPIVASTGPRIIRLNLCECDHITDIALSSVSSATALAELDLSWTNITDFGLSLLRGLKGLTTLAINGCYRITDRGFEHLLQFRQLKRLEFSMSTYLSSIYDSNITSQGLRHLASLSELMFLDLTRAVLLDDTGIEVLPHLSYLTDVDVSGCRLLTDAALEALSTITSLQHLALDRCKAVTNTGVRRLSVLRELRHLTLDGCEQASDDAIDTLTKLPQIHTLGLAGCPITDHLIEKIAQMPYLEKLSISSPNLTDRGIDALAHAPSLTWLTIDKSPKLTDQALRTITSMPKLQTVRLFKSAQFSGKCWKEMASTGKVLVSWEKDTEYS